MSLCYAAITPHTPLLLPTIGKDKLTSLAQTMGALGTISAHLHTHRPEILIIMSPHTRVFDSAFGIGAALTFSGTFETFGDLSTSYTYQGAPHAATQIAGWLRTAGFPIQLIADDTLDYGAAVPLHHILPPSSKTRVMPLGFSAHSPKYHYAFGQALREAILKSDERIAIIASGDLSHNIPINQSADTLDDIIEASFRQKRWEQFLSLPPQEITEADICAYLPLSILAGTLDTMNYRYRRLAYEHPFSVGYLSAEFLLT